MQDKSDLSRRKFLSTSAAGLVSTGLVALPFTNAVAQSVESKSEAKAAEVIYRTLGRTGIRLPIVSMGVMNADNPGIVEAAWERGIRHFDTAAYYQKGKNELMVGKVFKKMGVRDQAIIGTKVFTPGMREGLSPKETKAAILKQTDECLARLQMDYVDILYLHNVEGPEAVHDAAIQDAMSHLKEQGKTRHIGLSTHKRMDEVIDAAVEVKIYDVILTAINFTMAKYPVLLASMSNASKAGLGIVAMKTQAGGARRMPDQEILKRYSSETIHKAALKWAMRLDYITTSIPGFDNYEHLEQNFSVVSDLEYSEKESQFLSDNSVKLGFGYCHQCSKCVPQCPQNVDVPTLMRTHMYAARYGNFHHARATLDDIPGGRSLVNCDSCQKCVVGCANNLDIPGQIEELKLIYS